MPISIAILGSGNMAYHLLRAFDKAESVEIEALIVRDQSKGRKTIKKANVSCEVLVKCSLEKLHADVVFLAVSESSISEVLESYQFRADQTLVHTSGAEPISSLQHPKSGVFYPLQTLTWSEEIDFSNVPVLIEGSGTGVEETLLGLARKVSRSVQILSSEKRLVVHLAAVLASNFPNHLFERANRILNDVGLEPDVLHPLVDEMVRKAKDLGTKKAQTGPARRGDQKTMERHLSLLSDQRLKEIYKLISTDIADTHGIT